MLESGCVSLKNEVNIMMKNVVDVVLGGVTYWSFGKKYHIPCEREMTTLLNRPPSQK